MRAGQTLWQQDNVLGNSSGLGFSSPLTAVGEDGTAYVVQRPYSSTPSDFLIQIVKVIGNSGQVLGNANAPTSHGTSCVDGSCSYYQGAAVLGQPVITSDGIFNLPLATYDVFFSITNQTQTTPVMCSENGTFHIKLLRVQPNGGYSLVTVKDVNYSPIDTNTCLSQDRPTFYQSAFQISPDNTTGAFVTWAMCSANLTCNSVAMSGFHIVDLTSGAGYDITMPQPWMAVDQVVLGENGIAYALAGAGVDGSSGSTVYHVWAVDLNSNSVLWQTPSLSAGPGECDNLTAIAASSSGGIVIKDCQQIFGLDASGNYVADPSGLAGASASLDDYWANGMWVGHSSSSEYGLLGNFILAATSPMPHPGGRKKNAVEKPVFVMFEAQDPAPDKSIFAVGLGDRYNGIQTTNTLTGQTSTLGQQTAPVFRVTNGATWANFQTETSIPLHAVAFMGHSLGGLTVGGYPERAVGLCFFNFECIERPPLTGEPEAPLGLAPNFPDGPITSVTIEQALKTQAKVIFISACDMDANMQSWLGITLSTLGRALVVPNQNTQVDINMGEFAWKAVARHLLDIPVVTTVRAAVDAANIDINNTNWTDSSGNPIPAVNWKVIGDSSVRF